MSFILEALRRADAQRESHPGRGIHAQAMPLPVAAHDDPLMPAGRRRRWMAWVLALAAVGVAAWAAWRSNAPTQPLETARPLAVLTPAPQILPAAPPPVVAAKAAPASAAPAEASPRLAPPPAPQTFAVAGAAVPASGPSPIAGAWPADAPAVAVSGGVFAASPAQRMVIINGQVHAEGAEPVAGVRVQEIRQGAVVLTYRGQRYLVAY